MKRRALALMLLLGLLLASPAWAAHDVFTQHTIDTWHGENSVYATDVDGDGDMDVLGANWGITWWENDGSEVFTRHNITQNFLAANSVYATDVDGDGDVDVLGAAWQDNDITWWENKGPSGNPPPADPITWAEHTIKGDFDGAQSVYATDVDGDGYVDVLGAASGADDITWWENNPSGAAPPADPITWTEHTIKDDFDGARSVYATDVDGDGYMDVLGAANGANDITWWENDGSEVFTEHTIKADFGGASSVYATDVDGDDDVDVLGTGYDPGEIAWWENDGSEVFAEHTIKGDLYGAKSVYATDVDGDGDVDVLGTSDAAAIKISWWENLGTMPLSNGSFELGPRIPTPWQGQKLTLKDKRVCTTHYDGQCSFLMVGSTANKALKQVVNISGNAGDSFTLKGRSKAQNPSASGGAYCLEAKVFHTDATKKTYKACFTKSTHGWQLKQKTFTTEKDYTKIEVYLRYAKQSGQAWFDQIRLVAQ